MVFGVGGQAYEGPVDDVAFAPVPGELAGIGAFAPGPYVGMVGYSAKSERMFMPVTIYGMVRDGDGDHVLVPQQNGDSPIEMHTFDIPSSAQMSDGPRDRVADGTAVRRVSWRGQEYMVVGMTVDVEEDLHSVTEDRSHSARFVLDLEEAAFDRDTYVHDAFMRHDDVREVGHYVLDGHVTSPSVGCERAYGEQRDARMPIEPRNMSFLKNGEYGDIVGRLASPRFDNVKDDARDASQESLKDDAYDMDANLNDKDDFSF